MGYTMQGWQTTFLGMRELPRDISDFEMKAFFTFDGAEREAINARRGDAHKLGLALHIGFLRMSGRLLGAFRVDEMQAVADALSLLANIVMAWNTSQMQAVLDRWSNRRQVIPPELIGKIAPTRLESINLRGVFRFPVDRYADQILPSQGTPITGTNG